MKVTFRIVSNTENESVLFSVHQKTEALIEIANLIEKYQTKQILVKDYQKNITIHLMLEDIIYIEYIDRKCFFYTNEKSYEKRITLSRLASDLPEEFIQVSKTMLLNIRSVKEIKSSLLNGNLYCVLQNKEEILISRHFAKNFRKSVNQI